jgi:hypothetical protein
MLKAFFMRAPFLFPFFKLYFRLLASFCSKLIIARNESSHANRDLPENDLDNISADF